MFHGLALMLCELVKPFSICEEEWNVVLGSLWFLFDELVHVDDGVCFDV